WRLLWVSVGSTVLHFVKKSRSMWCNQGSLFNHSESPNVSYTIDVATESIRYTTVRSIAVNEELCIFYGHKLWFNPAGQSKGVEGVRNDVDGAEADIFGWLAATESDSDEASVSNPFAEGSPDDVIPEDELPFEVWRPPPEEETPETIRTGMIFYFDAWAVDVSDPKQLSQVLGWLKSSGLETDELKHLKRVNKRDGIISVLLSTSPLPPSDISSDLSVTGPYSVKVPTSAALTPISLAHKNALWPTVYAPRRKDEAALWTRGRVGWMWNAMKATIAGALWSQSTGELPIYSFVCGGGDSLDIPEAVTFGAGDGRTSSNHPLRHAVLDVIRQIAEYRASAVEDTASSSNSVSAEDTRDLVPDNGFPVLSPSPTPSSGSPQNGSNYLLTSLTLFTTHEPCVMCSMALVHSRVKRVVYLYPMEKTGGCGGLTRLPSLPGINHRFQICKWRWPEHLGAAKSLAVPDTTDT
ncbi:cytidine deaminase-like protein, partial [Fistulina hepatica ATCC 64428]